MWGGIDDKKKITHADIGCSLWESGANGLFYPQNTRKVCPTELVLGRSCLTPAPSDRLSSIVSSLLWTCSSRRKSLRHSPERSLPKTSIQDLRSSYSISIQSDCRKHDAHLNIPEYQVVQASLRPGWEEPEKELDRVKLLSVLLGNTSALLAYLTSLVRLVTNRKQSRPTGSNVEIHLRNRFSVDEELWLVSIQG
jgi:hypothetical protein